MPPIPSRPTLLATLTISGLIASGCATTGTTRHSLVPTGHKTQTGPYAVYTNFPLAPGDPAVLQLQALEHQIEETLGVRVDPGENPIEVYILDDKKAFTHFLTYYYPELPPRRAFFFAQGPRRVVYTYLGDRLEEDLRHEATHALINVAYNDLPLWLDEGLAEYFEVDPRLDGRNPEHLKRLPADVAGGWSPDLRRLESLQDVRQMTPRDYRESWAWVHYLLNGPPSTRSALLVYLRDNHLSNSPSLSDRLEAQGNDAADRLVAHLDRVEKGAVASESDPAIARASSVRFQDEVVPATPAPTRPRGPIGRMFDALLGRGRSRDR
jgi:hypothetical protein